MSDLLDPPASDDFEWVNSWATGAKPAPSGKPKQEPAPNAQSPAEPAVQPPPAAAPANLATAVQVQDTAARQPAEVAAPKPPVATQSTVADMVPRPPRKRGPEADQFVHPATRRFFAALRTQASAPRDEAPAVSAAPADAPTATRDPQPSVASPSPAKTAPAPSPAPMFPPTTIAEAAPIVLTSAVPAETPPVKIESTDASLAPTMSQLERDIAEIEGARDALLDPEPFTITDPRKPRSRLAALRHAESVPILVGSVVGATLLIVFGAAASLISLR